MDKQLIGQIRTLVHKECCNYISGKCVYEHDCTVINPSFSSIHDGAIGCDYFLECVLPIDPELNRIVWAELLRDEEISLREYVGWICVGRQVRVHQADKRAECEWFLCDHHSRLPQVFLYRGFHCRPLRLPSGRDEWKRAALRWTERLYGL